MEIIIHYHKFTYKNMNRSQCPCPILQAAIAYSSIFAAANHAANALQIDVLCHVNEMILEVIAVNGNFLKVAIISPCNLNGRDHKIQQRVCTRESL